jgi:tetratricopeptide (TPR) repeat protein
MNRKITITLGILGCVAQTGWAQLTAVDQPIAYTFEAAKTLFDQQQYVSSLAQFRQLHEANNLSFEQREACDYYSLLAAMQLQLGNAETMLETFVKTYPVSTRIQDLGLVAGHYFFQQEKYQQALGYFEKVEEQDLAPAARESFYFEKAYALFSQENRKEARLYFAKLTDSPKYKNSASYYLGYMAYENNQFADAQKLFVAVAVDETYKNKLAYPEADMNFKTGNFEQAIAKAKIALEKTIPSERSQLNKIIGESYFHLQQYDQALPFLKEYKGVKGKWNNTDHYQLGYVYYRQQDYANALVQFNQIISAKDAVAQNAYYHLGDCYLKLDKKQEAFQAFKSASEMDFEPKIQEEAMLNYAKLSFELGNSYQSVPDVLGTFINKYPASPARGTIEQLLIQSYLTAKNYREALGLLEKSTRADDQQTLQKVALFRGMELYTEGKYQEAWSLFKKSLGAAKDPVFSARAWAWKGETEYLLDEFNEAQKSLKQAAETKEIAAVPEGEHLAYNRAYVSFKLKDYDQAATFFQQYVAQQKADKARLHDAYIRLGDARFIQMKYWPALESYNKALDLKGLDADYAAFQKAICYGFINRNEKKITDLQQFIKTYKSSKYRDDALFELANTFVTEKNTSAALQTYDQLLTENKNGLYVSKALLRQGLIYFNAEKDDEALQKLKQVAQDFPSTPEALEAVATARLIYVENGKVADYATWVRGLGYVEVSDAQLDKDTFEAAEKNYLQNNRKAAISALEQYLATYPNGQFTLKTHFYLGQLYFAESLLSNAIPQYEAVRSQPKSEFSEPALVRLGEIYIGQENNEALLVVLKQLEAQADYPQNTTFAQANLMRVYFETNDYPQAAGYAEKLINNLKVDAKVRADAQIIIARAAFKANDLVKARAAYAKLMNATQGEWAAEATYYDAYFKNKDGQFEASNKAVQKLAKEYAPYRYYGAKGLIVMAQNYYALKDQFQATYILESVRKNFSQFPDVVQEAQERLSAMQTELAPATNSTEKP